MQSDSTDNSDRELQDDDDQQRQDSSMQQTSDLSDQEEERSHELNEKTTDDQKQSTIIRKGGGSEITPQSVADQKHTEESLNHGMGVSPTRNIGEIIDDLWENWDNNFQNIQDGRPKKKLPGKEKLKNVLSEEKSGSGDTRDQKWSDCLKQHQQKQAEERMCGYIEFSIGSDNYKLRISYTGGNEDSEKPWKMGLVKKDGNNGKSAIWTLGSFSIGEYPWNNFSHDAAKSKTSSWAEINYLDLETE